MLPLRISSGKHTYRPMRLAMHLIVEPFSDILSAIAPTVLALCVELSSCNLGCYRRKQVFTSVILLYKSLCVGLLSLLYELYPVDGQ